jgi:hypothetical protein
VWQPPDNPNPHAILHEAVHDGRTGHPDVALQKFLWFHEHATQFERGLYGVRLSFALGYWMDLASRYAPALDALVRTRDETESKYLEDPTNFELFHDLASLNSYLGEGERTATIFIRVASSDHEAAAGMYPVAEPHLVSIGAYDACGPFLNPDKRIAFAAECYRFTRRHESKRERREPSPPPMARRHYLHNVATLVALLVLNNRRDDARDAYNKSLLVIDDEEVRTTLDAAMAGHLPPP